MNRATRAAAFVLSVLFLTVLIGCDPQSGGAERPRESGTSATDCALSIREVRPDGSLVDPPLIRPEHVDFLMRRDEYGPTILVKLTPEGAQRMERYTKRHVGALLANFCGAGEISRTTITAPFGGEFQMSWRDPAP